MRIYNNDHSANVHVYYLNKEGRYKNPFKITKATNDFWHYLSKGRLVIIAGDSYLGDFSIIPAGTISEMQLKHLNQSGLGVTNPIDLLEELAERQAPLCTWLLRKFARQYNDIGYADIEDLINETLASVECVNNGLEDEMTFEIIHFLRTEHDACLMRLETAGSSSAIVHKLALAAFGLDVLGQSLCDANESDEFPELTEVDDLD